MKKSATVTMHGVRGSYPVSGARYRRYGGSTSCLSIETKTGIIVVDAGTGIAELGDELCRRASIPPITIVFTHFHLDHVMGLPSFKPILRKGVQVTLMADASVAPDWCGSLKTIMGKPFWPFGIAEAGANVNFEDLPRHTRSSEIKGPIKLYGVELSWCPVWHPQGCVGYRFKFPERVIVLGTDREQGNQKMDAVFEQFCHGADILIHDSQYTPEEYPDHAGWGHSTWEQSASLAKKIHAKQLILTSHDPGKSDVEIDRVLQRAKRLFPHTVAGIEQATIEELAGGRRRSAAAVEGLADERAKARMFQEDPPMRIRYTFRFDGGDDRVVTAQLHPRTLELVQRKRDAYPDWTALEHQKCSNCPLNERESPQCPAATAMIDVVEQFGRSISTEQVHVTIETDARTYVKRSALPEAVSSLIGVLMVTSGCPVMGKLRPMVRHHLPFATLEETQYRVFSMYLLAQFFSERFGRQPDWDLKELSHLYDGIHLVNTQFFKRLAGMDLEDANLNALVRLDTFADSISFSISHKDHDEIEAYFQAYFTPSDAQG